MRVVFVIPYFYPAWQYGGSPRAAFEYAKALVRRGHSVTVLTTDSLGSDRHQVTVETEPENVDGIQVYYYRNLSNRLAYRQRLFWPKLFFRSLPLQLKGADILHIHELRSALSVAAYRAAASTDVAYVLSPHGGLRRLGKAFSKMIYDAVWGSRILRSAAAVVVLSESEKKDALDRRVPSDRVVRLSNSVPTDLVSERPASGRFRKKWNIGSDRQLIVFLGRLHRVKGADVLLHAFARLARDDRNWHLVIGGPDDGEESELRRIASMECNPSKVTFTGYLDAQAKAELFVDADLLVIPSRSEAFPVTLLEALLFELPVLLSDGCDLVRTFKPRHGVDSFRSEDINDLCFKLESILASDTLRKGARDGRLLVQREYLSERVGEELERLYSSIVQRDMTK